MYIEYHLPAMAHDPEIATTLIISLNEMPSLDKNDFDSANSLFADTTMICQIFIPK